MEADVKKLIPHIVGDLTYMFTTLLRSHRRGSDAIIDELLSVKPLPDDYLRLAEDKGVSFFPDAKATNWVAIKDNVMIDSVQGGSAYECAERVCNTYKWAPPMRTPQQYLSVTQYLGSLLHSHGATIVMSRGGGVIWVRDSLSSYESDPILGRAALDISGVRASMPKMLASANTSSSNPQAA